jgi:hypothetical protein
MKINAASTRIESSGFSELALSLEWAALKEDAVQRPPSKQAILCLLSFVTENPQVRPKPPQLKQLAALLL